LVGNLVPRKKQSPESGSTMGRWVTYDETGKITSQEDFEDGKKLPPAYELRKQPAQ
jgi:hypothetical protein